MCIHPIGSGSGKSDSSFVGAAAAHQSISVSGSLQLTGQPLGKAWVGRMKRGVAAADHLASERCKCGKRSATFGVMPALLPAAAADVRSAAMLVCTSATAMPVCSTATPASVLAAAAISSTAKAVGTSTAATSASAAADLLHQELQLRQAAKAPGQQRRGEAGRKACGRGCAPANSCGNACDIRQPCRTGCNTQRPCYATCNI
mmetsp:Transcript_40543/g.120974  ORF Transcript_40543/g.120974 Transcript_40543/m.120974 type:complete len:203 (+) Transcript_40543:241-849(+)